MKEKHFFYLSIFSILIFVNQAWGRLPDANVRIPAPRPTNIPGAGQGNISYQVSKDENSVEVTCKDTADRFIMEMCSKNPIVAQIMEDSNMMGRWFDRQTASEEMLAKAKGNAGITKDLYKEASNTHVGLTQAIAQCNNAMKVCKQNCQQNLQTDVNNHAQRIRELEVQIRTGGPEAASLEMEKVGLVGSIERKMALMKRAFPACEKEHKTTQAKNTTALAGVGKVGGELMNIAKALGVALPAVAGLFGGDENDLKSASLTPPTFDELDDEECTKFGVDLESCKEDRDRRSSRQASLGGIGLAGAGNANGDGGVFAASTAGGDKKDRKKSGNTNSGSAAGGSFGGGFGGGFGSGSFGSGGGSNGSGGSDGGDLNAGGSRGFMSASGSGGGGGGGYSSGSGRYKAPSFGRGASRKLAATNPTLNSRINKVKKAQARGIASKGGDRNSPFKYNWDTIREAYKGNRSSLHKQ